MTSIVDRDVTSAQTISRRSACGGGSIRWLTALLVMGCGASAVFASSDVSAQSRKPSPTLTVAPRLQLSPGSENKLDINIAPEDAIPPRAVIVIRGVPARIALSEGRPFGPGVWVIPATRLTSVKLRAPLEGVGGGALTVALTTLEGTLIAEAHVTLILAPPQDNTAATKPAAGQDNAAAPTGATDPASSSIPKLTPQNRAELLLLLEKGNEGIRLGNILHARQFFQRAAEKGLAEAALALAATYDPAELARMKGVTGVVPDPELARKWYERARQLGSPEAAARLSQLSRR